MRPLASIAITVGAPILGQILRGLGGPAGAIAGDVAEIALKKIGERLGVEPTEDAIAAEYDKSPDETGAVLREVSDAMAPVYLQGLEGQFALLQGESKEGIVQSAWRWGWMYLLAAFWVWRIVILPLLNRGNAAPVEAVDIGLLLTLTSIFCGLYMGGHTLKDLGKNIAGALAKRR